MGNSCRLVRPTNAPAVSDTHRRTHTHVQGRAHTHTSIHTWPPSDAQHEGKVGLAPVDSGHCELDDGLQVLDHHHQLWGGEE